RAIQFIRTKADYRELDAPGAPTIPNDDPSGLFPLITRLRDITIRDLTKDDIKLLLACHRLLAKKKKLFNEERDYFDIIVANLVLIVEVAQTMELNDWLDHVTGVDSEGFDEVDEKDLRKRPKRSFKTLASIQRTVTGRMCKATGSLVVRGDVPDDSIVIADHGSVTVDGYVFGTVLAVGDIIIRKNISGMAISKNGDIQCRKVLGNSFIVAKGGNVSISEVVSAERIFAKGKIHVTGAAHGVHMIAPSVEIDGEANDCSFEVLDSLQVSRIVVEKGFISRVILRREINPEDYDVPLAIECVSLRNRVFALLSKRKRHTKYLMSTVKEMDLTAHRCLVFVLGGESFTPGLAKMEVLEKRQQFIESVLTILEGVESLILDKVKIAAWSADGGPEDAFTDVEKELKSLGKGLKGIEDDDLKRTLNLLATLRDQLADGAAYTSTDKLKAILDEIERNLTEWRMEKEAIEGSVREMTDSMDMMGQIKGLEGRQGTYVQVLQKLVKSKLAKTDKDIARRIASGATSRLLKNISSCQNNLKFYQDHISDMDKELSSSKAMLEKKYGYSLNVLDEQNPKGAYAKGVFEGGVVFSTSMDLVEDMRLANTRRVLVAKESGAKRRFVRLQDMVAEELAEE
ncbi:hypothetical protein ACFL1X_12690, partial [Candidatus Hydrogenedentota bacterium]